MEEKNRFSVIFDELKKDENKINISSFSVDAESSKEEFEEIAELRSIVCEMSEGDQFVYTST